MMGISPVAAGALAAGLGAFTAWSLARLAIQRPPAQLVRSNHRGKEVGAVLGGPLIAAAAWGPIALLATTLDQKERYAGGLALLIGLLGVAGYWDDLRGDERQRGFKGHLGAARHGRLTGGLLKLLVGGLCGLLVSSLLVEGLVNVVLSAMIIALSANLINLFDRAPGRAGKVTLLLVTVIIFFAPDAWRLGAAALIGAVLALMPFDLREKGMLGDAGANPIGAVAGLGLVLSLSDPGRAVAALALLVINAASERWSFSAAIASVPALNRLDRLGREEKSA